MIKTLIFISIFLSFQNVHAKGFLELILKSKDQTTGEYLMNIKGTVYDKDGNEVQVIKANDKGQLVIELAYQTKFVIHVEDETHDPLTIAVNTEVSEDMYNTIFTFTATAPIVSKRKNCKVKYHGDDRMHIIYKTSSGEFGLLVPYLADYYYKCSDGEDILVKKNPIDSAKTKTASPIVEKSLIDSPNTSISDAHANPNNNTKVDTENVAQVEPPNKVDSPPYKPELKKNPFPPIDDRIRSSRKSQYLSNMEKEKSKLRDLQAQLQKAIQRRSFMEELADSKRSNKQRDNNYIP